jgi:osmotically-inducible protein OsmY
MSRQSAAHARPTPSPTLTRAAAPLLARRQTPAPLICVQREAAGPATHPSAPSLVRDVVDSPGRPLDSATRSLMEPHFGYDFSRVRVHTDRPAAESAQALSANAYTAGNHVAFGAGRYTPGTSGGKHLLAHELTHVVQQAKGPVPATRVVDGLSVSHPQDHFEQAARETGARAMRAEGTGPRAAETRLPLPDAQRADKAKVVQRAFIDTSPNAPNSQLQTNAAQTSAAAGEASAIAGGVSALGALVSGFEAIRQANFAERAAQAAEDPPVAEPTTGGVASTHIELPEVKGIHLQSYKEDPVTQNVKTVSGERPISQGYKHEKKIPLGKGETDTETQSDVRKTNEEGKIITTTAVKVADKPDQETPFTVLRLTEGKENSADFLLTLRYNGTDVRGGATEDGEINGYLGGSAQSNAAVTFRASPGKSIETIDKDTGEKIGIATVRLLFGGTNVPPRKKTGLSTGFLGLGKGGTEDNKNYKIQRFSASVRLAGDGTLAEPPAVRFSPKGPDSVMLKPGDGKESPFVTLSLNPSPAAPGGAGQPAPAAATPQKAGGGAPAPAPTGGGGKP